MDDIKKIEQILKKCRLGFLYALLSALHQTQDSTRTKVRSKGSQHIGLEKEYCINKILTLLKNSDDPAALIEKADTFLKVASD